MTLERLKVSAPGRLCLLGEHQDYFGLAIIAAAINLNISITGKSVPEPVIRLDLPDIDSRDEFPLDRELPYTSERDYLKSAVNILRRMGLEFPSGWECRVRGTIPINSGTASSSALVVAWINFLLKALGDARASDPGAVAELAFQAEVAEFKEPGGKMDHYAAALGGVVFIRFGEEFKVQSLTNQLQDFVLADSLIRKNTTGTLGFIKSNVLNAVANIQKNLPGFSLYSKIGPRELEELEQLGPDEKRLLRGTINTRDITAEGKSLFEADSFDHEAFGLLLNRQQDVVRDDLRISAPKIDRMITVSLEAGALGAKINGSGEGGCILAYAPGKAEEVAEALKKLDTRPHVVQIGGGVKTELSE